MASPAAGRRPPARRLRAARAEVEKAYLLRKIEFPHPIRATPAAAGGILYVATERTLYTVAAK